MRLLAIETATEACSVALFENGRLLGAAHETIGRGHAERLVPMIANLEDKGRADEIRVSLGPGSFTGIRIGLATARALGVAWGAPVRGYPTLALVASMARSQGAQDVTVCMTGGHGEWFIQDFGDDGLPAEELLSLTPTAAAAHGARGIVAGSKAEELADLLDDRPAIFADGLPNASQCLSLPEQLLTDILTPHYGRPPDAKRPSK